MSLVSVRPAGQIKINGNEAEMPACQLYPDFLVLSSKSFPGKAIIQLHFSGNPSITDLNLSDFHEVKQIWLSALPALQKLRIGVPMNSNLDAIPAVSGDLPESCQVEIEEDLTLAQLSFPSAACVPDSKKMRVQELFQKATDIMGKL